MNIIQVNAYNPHGDLGMMAQIPVIETPKSLKQEDYCEFQGCLGYRVDQGL